MPDAQADSAFTMIPSAHPFFMPAGAGQRFCLYHAPDPSRPCLGAFLLAPPFAEELNRSRRVCALAARALASMGYAVLRIDLAGCGDSSGDMHDASWALWKEDLRLARDWLEQRGHTAIHLWGIRLGALLALDFSRDDGRPLDGFLLWQPVLAGRAYLTQFLRMRLAADMFSGGGEITDVAGLRAMLARGETLEITGYDLTPSLAAEIDALDAAAFERPRAAVQWLEIASDTGGNIGPAKSKLAHHWRQAGVEVHLHAVPDAPFWSSQETQECPGLISATGKIYQQFDCQHEL